MPVSHLPTYEMEQHTILRFISGVGGETGNAPDDRVVRGGVVARSAMSDNRLGICYKRKKHYTQYRGGLSDGPP